METMHHLTAGMKSVYSQEALEGLYTIRQSLGGAGYTNWSGLPSYIDDISPTVTFEGDNTVMSQQCFNLLMKIAK